MKRIGAALVLGLLAIVLAVAVYATQSSVATTAIGPCPPICDAAKPVSVDEAQQFNKEYVSVNKPNIAEANKIKAFTVNAEQLSAMNTLAAAHPELAGFRIYTGSKNSDELYTVVGVDSTGKDVIPDGVYQTSSAISGPCPTVCDDSSPLNVD